MPKKLLPKKRPANYATISFRVPTAENQRIKRICKELGCSVTEFLRSLTSLVKS